MICDIYGRIEIFANKILQSHDIEQKCLSSFRLGLGFTLKIEIRCFNSKIAQEKLFVNAQKVISYVSF